jgi:AraC-like DNA-binding protein
MSDETVPIHLVHRLMQSARRHGVDPAPLLREAGISDDVAYNARAQVTLDQLAAVMRSLWALTGDEMFGVGPHVPLGTFRLLTRSVIGAPDLREVLIRMDQASRVITGLPRLTTQIDQQTATVALDFSRVDDPEHLATDTLVILIHRSIGWAIGRRVPLTRVQMPYDAPPFLRYYESMFGRIPEFGADRASIAFDAALLRVPVLRTDSDIDEFIAQSPRNFLSTRDYGSRVSDQVRRILEQGLTGDWPAPEDLASRLSVSVDHLRRLLREDDTSITQLREDIRRDAAINSLVAGKESIDELADRLGFSEPSAFRRAFRRWTGLPPGAYRAGLAEGDAKNTDGCPTTEGAR